MAGRLASRGNLDSDENLGISRGYILSVLNVVTKYCKQQCFPCSLLSFTINMPRLGDLSYILIALSNRVNVEF